MNEIKIGIIGFGHVGQCLIGRIPIKREGPISHICVYDKQEMLSINTKDEINQCNYVFICVPTPINDETDKLDTSAVDEVLDWCTVKNICIRSTVPVGYTESKTSERNIVFSPEYYGETNQHPYQELGAPWLILGGEPKATKIFADLMQSWYPSTAKIHLTDSRTAELAKFMENSFLATKVIFCNTFYDIAEAYGVDYYKLREIWLLDPRMGESHTMVYPDNRGYGGKCLPKDIQNITTQAKEKAVNAILLEGVIESNYCHRLPF